MKKLTNIEVYEYVMLLNDKSRGVDFDEKEVSDLLNAAYIEWVDSLVRKGEVNDRNKTLLDQLVYKRDYGSVKKIRLSLLPGVSFRVWNVLCNYEFECKGIKSTLTRPVVPKTHDQIGVAMSNPFESPTDWWPFYTRYSEGGAPVLEIHSDNLPKEVEVTYVKMPETFDAVNNPDGFMEVSIDAQYQVCDLLLAKMLINTENYNAAQAVIQNEVLKN